jgi:hypothetical protein
LRRTDPAITDYDAAKQTLQKQLTENNQRRIIINAKLVEAKPQLDIEASHAKAKAIPKILLSVSLDREVKEFDAQLCFTHHFHACDHNVKLSVFDLIPDSDPNAWNALVDQMADFDGQVRCPKCVSEKNSLRAKLKEKIDALRARMPEATIADEEPRKTVSTAHYNVHIKR